MKKSLIAFAIFGAFAASASAQSSVTLYGIIDAATVHKTTQTASGGTGTLESGFLGTSRWGIKGSEDLGGGLKANFNLEGTLANDTGAVGAGFGTAAGGSPLSQAGATTSVFDRLSWVGLSGAFGAVTMGRNNMLAIDALAGADPMGLAHPATNPNLYFSALNGAPFFGNFGTNLGGSALRQNNSVKYSMPIMSGFGGAAMYGFGEKAGDGGANSYKGLSGFFTDGKSIVGVNYAKMQDGVGYSGGGSTLTQTGFGAKIVMDAKISIKGTYAQTKVDTTQRKIAVFGIGMDYALTPTTTLTGAYYDTKLSGAAKGRSDQYVALAKYAFSKRTIAYASATHVNVDTKANAALAIGIIGAGFDHANRFGVGMQHSF
ncbi:MAG: porin [Pseudomonadota bacterium]